MSTRIQKNEKLERAKWHADQRLLEKVHKALTRTINLHEQSRYWFSHASMSYNRSNEITPNLLPFEVEKKLKLLTEKALYVESVF